MDSFYTVSDVIKDDIILSRHRCAGAEWFNLLEKCIIFLKIIISPKSKWIIIEEDVEKGEGAGPKEKGKTTMI